MKHLKYLLLLIPVLSIVSCEQQDLFGGPRYDIEGNLAIDSVKIAEYLRDNPIEGERINDPSGVVIIVQEEGIGSRPTPSTVVYTDFVGSLLDGSVFDTTYEDIAKENDIFQENRTYGVYIFNIPPVGSSGNSIQGFSIGFKRLRPQSKAVLLIPSPYGYQDSDNNDRIPPNSVLRFDVDFRGID
ncbi:FKBP-type peptidyl-prolyl cis-trans isomerase [Belliella sp. R4-6]|uniref:Peptidyl-prolyl cis-trans isomerase n=1 Tax=Belliella alkalica TaxID=1730871 RepID=A0ABS9VA08_9BACT|nr:FKBP-type peptidyl-prolyl cis-trans isomerase [Belliella alkalica]MCH7413254.1 FKBP-type peptidyl-prolyl cis-trans isomerase [Belliella alkalica]